MKKDTPAGAALFWVAVAVIVAVTGWMLWSLPGWLEGWRLGRVAGVIAVIGLGAVILLAVPAAVMALYALTAVGLEALGLRLEQPEPASELTAEEEARAAESEVYSVWYVYKEEDPAGHDLYRGALVSVHPDRDAAEADRAQRKAPPAGVGATGGRYDLVGPWNLLAACLASQLGAEEARELLRGHRVELPPKVGGSPYGFDRRLLTAPLTRAELARAREVRVWTVYFEDRFAGNPHERSSYPVALCFSREAADAEVRRRGPLEPRSVGHEAVGPSALAAQRTPDIGADVVRKVLKRLERGDRTTVPLQVN